MIKKKYIVTMVIQEKKTDIKLTLDRGPSGLIDRDEKII